MWFGCGKLDPAVMIWPHSGCMLAINGHNLNASESDPTCLLGWHVLLQKLATAPSVTLVFQSLCQFFSSVDPHGLLDLPKVPNEVCTLWTYCLLGLLSPSLSFSHTLSPLIPSLIVSYSVSLTLILSLTFSPLTLCSPPLLFSPPFFSPAASLSFWKVD